MAAIHLARAPRSDDELWWTIKALWGISLPRVSVCPEHCSPFDAVAHAYFSREPNFAVWYASRGSGKSLALAVLGLTKTFVADADCTILGGSSYQSQNVRKHMAKMLLHKNAPRYAVARSIQTAITTTTGKEIIPLPASQTSVRGPHPPLQLLDEVDEMDKEVYQASLGQAMEQLNERGELVGEYIVCSSTWQNPLGTFTDVIDDARKRGLPIFSWCWRELLKSPANPHGWMSRRFIDNKRRHVSAQMWKVEYELNEPAGTSRAFDLDKIEEYFVDYPHPIGHGSEGETDEWWRWEDYQPTGSYAAGADWAKENDKTVIVVVRTDITPRQVVYLRRMNRLPYDMMAKAFSDEVTAYNAAAKHDKTGVGNAVNDFLSADAAHGFVMTGRPRSQLFVDYIADFEHGGFRLPKSCPIGDVTPFYKAHRGATVADVYAPHRWDEHTPDDLVAMAMMHKAAGRTPGAPKELPEVPRSEEPRKADAPFWTPSENARVEGLVEIVDTRYDDPFMDRMSIYSS